MHNLLLLIREGLKIDRVEMQASLPRGMYHKMGLEHSEMSCLQNKTDIEAHIQ